MFVSGGLSNAQFKCSFHKHSILFGACGWLLCIILIQEVTCFTVVVELIMLFPACRVLYLSVFVLCLSLTESTCSEPSPSVSLLSGTQVQQAFTLCLYNTELPHSLSCACEFETHLDLTPGSHLPSVLSV